MPGQVKNAKINQSGSNVELSWSKADGLEIENYLVYRKYKNGKTELASTLGKSTTSFTENDNVDVDGYYILAQEYSGIKSEPVVLEKD